MRQEVEGTWFQPIVFIKFVPSGILKYISFGDYYFNITLLMGRPFI